MTERRKLSTGSNEFMDRVAVLGFPDSVQRFHSHAPASWTLENLNRVRGMGFTQVQLNLAWGARPDDEPLNLEDLVDPSEVISHRSPQVVELNCRPGPAARLARRAMVTQRLALARKAGLKTLFHFGAPYNRHAHYGDTPPNCICDNGVLERYEDLIRRFAADFGGVDDLLVYTYDQDAWLCGEFGGCHRCNGVPLHERLPPFLETLRRTWSSINPAGRLWWEPWELSGGQIHECVDRMSPECFGLALHGNVAECMAAVVADPWFVRTARHAQVRGIPVWAEWFLGGVSEETEPISHLAHPLTVWRGLQRFRSVCGVTGLKEYYGLLPERLEVDVNLQTTVLFLREPDLREDEVLDRLSRPYGKSAQAVAEAWRLASEAMERYPWDCSWLGREIGRSRTDHAMTAAILRPMLCPTPSWQSSRGTVFMRTENTKADPWMLEDVTLRARQAADMWGGALALTAGVESETGADQTEYLREWRNSLSALRRRAVANGMHLRATLIAIAARRRIKDGIDLSARSADEMREVLRTSRSNHREECLATCTPDAWDEMDRALSELDGDFRGWLERWLLPVEDRSSRGPFSLTSA